MTVKERIKAFARTQEKTVRAFEAKSGLKIGYINAIRVSIQPDKLQSIASNYPNLNIDWLLTGIGQMLKSEDQSEEKTNNQINNEEMINQLKEQLKERNEFMQFLKDDNARLRNEIASLKEERAALKQTGS